MAATDDFIKLLAPACQAAARRYGVWASVAIAQSALETGWGAKSDIARDHNAYFGVKWQGNQLGPFPEHVKGITLHRTTERPSGRPEFVIDAWFRTYASVTDSALDYAANLRSKKVYADTGCWEAETADAFIKAIGPTYTGGDLQYAGKVLDIMQRHDLRRFDTPKETPVARATYYPPANRTVQNFSAKYPGGAMTPNVLLLHTTEGSSWPDYQGGAATPHFTMRFANGKTEIRQHLPVDRSARALRDAPGGVVTNRLNVVQVELIGTSGWASAENPGRPYTVALKAQDFPDYALRAIAELWVWLHREWDVPLSVTPRGFVRWNAKRPTMTNDEWNNFRGLCGHQHVPENDHSDPGAINAPRILEFARQIAGGTPAKPAPSAPKPEQEPAPQVLAANPPGDDVPPTMFEQQPFIINHAATGEGWALGPEVFAPQDKPTRYTLTAYINGSEGTNLKARVVALHAGGWFRYREINIPAVPGQPTQGQIVHTSWTHDANIPVHIDVWADKPDNIEVVASAHVWRI